MPPSCGVRHGLHTEVPQGLLGLEEVRGRALGPLSPQSTLDLHSGSLCPKEKQAKGSIRTGFGSEKQKPEITWLQHDQTLSLFYMKAGKLAVQAWCGWLLRWVPCSESRFPSSPLSSILRGPDVPRCQPIDPCSRKENGGRDKTDWGKQYKPTLFSLFF